ncbi:MAG: elongation factor P maturation arginine rhamnosyltransferase EarP [Pseudohongiella sp.]|nr:elongation factor P maturation arginine rhamnosyltransferase EarP [Pseudohongiella sp.]
MPPRWTIFCAMIDNFGDIGVSWRLARQLVGEKGIRVDLWVDDWAGALQFLQAQTPGAQLPASAKHLTVAGVDVYHWPENWPDDDSVNTQIAESQCVVETFGCELPDAVKRSMSRRAEPLVWINLEYLSAEDWVRGCHGLPSPQNLSPLIRKYFFFPGFEPATGGLLRESGLLMQHQAWQAHGVPGRQQLLFDLGLASLALPELLVSVFSYCSASMVSWLEALADGTETVLCLVPEGKASVSMAAYLGVENPVVGSVHHRGVLTVAVIPFRSQDDYDQLLSLCDFNIVRGEDSFVRAQWAAKPFMWHIYPQDDGVHVGKLEAFAVRYLEGLDPKTAGAWARFARGWNLGEDCAEMWHYLRPQLPDLHQHTQEWQKKLAVMPDLATNLVNFETFTKLSVSP